MCAHIALRSKVNDFILINHPFNIIFEGTSPLIPQMLIFSSAAALL